MLSIEEYIARRKKEDKLNEFDIDARTHNMKICVDYVFEYFNNYLNITEAEEKTVLHNEKLEKYRKQLREYDPEVREWAVGIYNEYGKQIHKHIGNIMRENEFFFLYSTDSEFRNASYDCYSQLIKRLPFLKDQTEMLFLFIKDYHRVESEQRFNFGIPSITEEITDWIEKTWAKYQVNILAFAYSWIIVFMTTRMFGHQHIERRANILGGSTTTTISRKVTFLTLIHYIERCRKNPSLKEESKNLKYC